MERFAIAVILGIIEGLTEFVPVSSTGHLIIAGHVLGFVGEKASSFEVVIQLGAVLSVVLLYRRTFVDLIPWRSGLSLGPEKSSLQGWSGLWRIAVATLPALTAAYLARHLIKEKLFTPEAVTLALAVGGVAILLAERLVSRRRCNSIDRLTVMQAFGVGLFQVLALWPGTSRAAATIIGGMVVGLDRKSAAEFSFLIAVPIMLAATGYELIQLRNAFNLEDALQFGTGFIVSFAVALVAVTGFIRFLERGRLTPFAWYRLAAAPAFYFLTRGVTF